MSFESSSGPPSGLEHVSRGYTLGASWMNGGEGSSTRRNINPRPHIASAPTGYHDSLPSSRTNYAEREDGEQAEYEIWQDEAEADVEGAYGAPLNGGYELSEDGFEEVEPEAVLRAESPDYGVPSAKETPSAGPSNWESKAALQTALAKLEEEVRRIMSTTSNS